MDKVNPAELSDVQLIALGTSIKSERLDALKNALGDGHSSQVDFTVRVFGGVQKGNSTPGGSYEIIPTVSFASLNLFCQVLAIIGIGKDRLRRALEEIEPANLYSNDVLQKVFADVAAEKAAKLPKGKGFSSGKRGSVTSQINVEKLA